MELCRCLWTVKSNTSFNNFARILNGSRCFYLTLVHEIGEASISQVNDTISVCFVYPTYRSLSIISIPALLTLCDLLFLFTQVTCPSNVYICKSYLLLIYKTLIFSAAANWTSIMSKAIYSGLNLTYLLHTIKEPVSRFSVTIVSMVVQINAILSSGNNNVHYLLCLRSM